MTVLQRFHPASSDRWDPSAPLLPLPVGAMSTFTNAVIEDPRLQPGRAEIDALDVEDPLGDLDFQRSLYCLHELHYRGFDTAHPDAEWHPGVMDWWYRLAGRFEIALQAETEIPADEGGSGGATIVERIAEFDGPSLSSYVAEHPTDHVLSEFAIHRSAYQLKEADPHSFALPRLGGSAKAALVEIQMDEYGDGVPGHSHAELFATTMSELELDSTYGAYLPRLPATTLATTNLITHLALHRRLLPALLGHLALFEMTSVVPMGRYAGAMRQAGMSDAACAFYDVHVEADEHHGPLAQTALVDAYLSEHPQHVGLVVWGAILTMAIERRFAAHLLERWASGRSSLLSAEPE